MIATMIIRYIKAVLWQQNGALGDVILQNNVITSCFISLYFYITIFDT